MEIVEHRKCSKCNKTLHVSELKTTEHFSKVCIDSEACKECASISYKEHEENGE
jgi:hypothetical protein